MKLQELFEAADNPFTFIKELNAQFKALAKESKLTMVTGMSWPAVTKDGGWFGGGFQPLGGAKKAQQDLVKLPIEIHVKGFINELAPVLEKLQQQGHQIAVGEGAHYKVKFPAAPGKIKEALLSSMRMEKPKTQGGYRHTVMPCVVWFVSLPKELADTELLRISVSLRHGPNRVGDYDAPRTEFMIVASSTPEKNKAYEKKFKAFNRANRAEFDLNTHQTTPASPAWIGMTEDLLALAVKHGKAPASKAPVASNFGAIALTRKIGTKVAIKVDLAELTTILDKYL